MASTDILEDSKLLLHRLYSIGCSRMCCRMWHRVAWSFAGSTAGKAVGRTTRKAKSAMVPGAGTAQATHSPGLSGTSCTCTALGTLGQNGNSSIATLFLLSEPRGHERPPDGWKGSATTSTATAAGMPGPRIDAPADIGWVSKKGANS